jgi:YesN/AraC family two-component response regulator
VYKLFLADDEMIIINGLKKLLDWTALDIEIAGEATNGRDAEEQILESRPDLAILDIRMPLRSGLDILHAIKNRQLETKVIFLSAHEEFGYARDALESGAQNYLTKPVDKEKLFQAVKAVLRRIDSDVSARDAMEKVQHMEKENNPPGKEIRFSVDDFLKSIDNEQIRRIIVYMNEHYGENISLDRIAKMAYMNPYYFSVFFKKTTGRNFKECLTRIRLEHAITLLNQEDIKTYELAERVGFSDPRYFSELFKKIYGKTPLEYKKEQ